MVNFNLVISYRCRCHKADFGREGLSQPAKEYEEKLLDVGTKVRYLYEPGELEGYQYKGERRKRSTDPI